MRRPGPKLDRGNEFDRWAAWVRERRGLGPDEPFITPFTDRLPDFVDVSQFNGNPDVFGFCFHRDRRMEPVWRTERAARTERVVSISVWPGKSPWLSPIEVT